MDKTQYIKEKFSLSKSALKTILKNEDSSRINDIFKLAKKWNEQSEENIGYCIYSPLRDDDSLFFYLSQDELNISKLEKIIKLISEYKNNNSEYPFYDYKIEAINKELKEKGFESSESNYLSDLYRHYRNYY